MIDDGERELLALLKSVLEPTYLVYSDVVPESDNNGAVAITNVANPTSRVLSGKKYGMVSTWRVTVIAPSKSVRQTIGDILETLDNTSNNDFNRVYVDLVNKEGKDTEDQPVVRSFYDITLR